jgi:hypothetical protein
MESSVGFRVLEKTVALIVVNPGFILVFLATNCEVIAVHEVRTSVVRWVDVYHLDFAEIALLQELQDIKVIALDVEVLCRILILAFLRAGAKRLAHGSSGLAHSLALANPSELIRLIAIYLIAKQRA